MRSVLDASVLISEGRQSIPGELAIGVVLVRRGAAVRRPGRAGRCSSGRTGWPGSQRSWGPSNRCPLMPRSPPVVRRTRRGDSSRRAKITCPQPRSHDRRHRTRSRRPVGHGESGGCRTPEGSDSDCAGVSARTSAGIETCPFDETFMTSAVGVDASRCTDVESQRVTL